jgi:orotidine-5'-phosphate decarboxylase
MFVDKLRRVWSDKNTLLCVGLDPEPARFPASFAGKRDAIFEFNRAIIDATADLVCAFKPQIAHYAAYGAEDQLTRTIDYIRQHHPEIAIILDAKRGDIGSTAEMYAREAFDRYGADAVTVNPYMGVDAVAPFLARADKGVVILCRTSNPGARTFQDLEVSGKPLYLRVAEEAVTRWNEHKNVLLLAGATYPAEIRQLRAIAGDVPFLVPGVGAQGASLSEAVSNGQDANGTGLVISSSRAVLYASSGADFERAARAVAEGLKAQINGARARQMRMAAKSAPSTL